ncbi:DUF5675 family protein [Marinobacter shengliensis]|uniref:DUF5675 family protein n=1 Tax=Marinobacter shengliensis TaxID=1389223 RepID=UPI001E3CEE52|nr:DUF5675 family protein [Marinobacter shengliensis]MCD1628477.1 DUF5675 family protein [Marinobacter shengliensis]
MEAVEGVIRIARFDRLEEGVFGKWKFPDGWECFTVERPWLDNKPMVSCIPDGVYSLGLRYSPTVQRITRGRYREGWEIQDVPGRTFIMVHPANWPTDLNGCVGVGEAYTELQGRDGKMHKAVTNSQKVFDEVMSRMEDRSVWDIDIYTDVVEYP